MPALIKRVALVSAMGQDIHHGMPNRSRLATRMEKQDLAPVPGALADEGRAGTMKRKLIAH